MNFLRNTAIKRPNANHQLHIALFSKNNSNVNDRKKHKSSHKY